jgi:two-component system response regulator FixJ
LLGLLSRFLIFAELPVGLRKPTVCIVDSDAAIRSALSALVSTLPVHVLLFSDAETLLSDLPGEELACVIAEVDLPGRSGIQLVEEMVRKGRRVPTILLTSDSDVPTAVSALQAGAVDFIEKPFVDRQLLERVERAVT